MSADASQPGILAPAPPVARSVAFRIVPDADLRSAIKSLREGFEPELGVAGIGEPLLRALGARVPGLRVFPALAGAGASVPSTQAALWFFLRGAERGAVFDATEGLDDGISDALFSFSRPLRGGYYWCPPLARGRLDLSVLGLWL
ncbi:MAG: hypothetical protein WEF50_14310 [Myxococcota bacterium]